MVVTAEAGCLQWVEARGAANHLALCSTAPSLPRGPGPKGTWCRGEGAWLRAELAVGDRASAGRGGPPKLSGVLRRLNLAL